jgi:hypothetical protein
MSHRTLSWILTLTAFLLFALACTLGRNAADTDDGGLQKKNTLSKVTAAVTGSGVLQSGMQTLFSPKKLRFCAMKEFYRQNPSLKGHLTAPLEAAIRVKMVDHLRAQIKTIPPDLEKRFQRCLKKPTFKEATLANK